MSLGFSKKVSAKPIYLLAAILVLLFCKGCGTDYKKIGSSDDLLVLDLNNDESNTNYALAFGLRSTQTSRAIEVQAIANSESTFVEICGGAGANCKCQFADNKNPGSNVLDTDTSLTYKSDGNYFTCSMSANTISDPSAYKFVRINTNSEGQATSFVRIFEEDKTSGVNALQLSDFMKGLDASLVRNIYSYKCRFNFIQSINYTRTTGTLTCDDATNNQFFGIAINYTYYLYSDRFSNNLGARLADFPYANGNLCSLAARQIECTQTLEDLDGTSANVANKNTLAFGLYAEKDGIFEVKISATSAPSLLGGTSETYGYAASTDSSGNCPPFFEERALFTATAPSLTNGGTFTNSSANNNYDTTQVDGIIDTEANGTTNTLTNTVYNGGLCNSGGTSCATFPPITQNANQQSTTSRTFSQSGGTFCVIPSSILVE